MFESSDKVLNKLVNKKILFHIENKTCRICGNILRFEVYCYKCYKENDKDGEKLDIKIEKYIHSLSYVDLSSLLSSVRQSHVNNCIQLGTSKRKVKSISDLYGSFTKEIKTNIFASYGDLYKYSKRNIDTLFKNDKFSDKLEIKIDNTLKNITCIFSTELYNYEYDKQLFSTKTIENIKSLMEIDIKERTKDHIPSAKLGKYMRSTKKTDGSVNQGKKYAYGKIIDILDKINIKDHSIEIIQFFREFLIKDIVEGETMFLDGLIFLKIGEKKYHPIVLELDDTTHDRLTDPKYRLNDLAKNIFCKKNGISIIRLDTIRFTLEIIVRILKVIVKSKKAKLVAKKTYSDERLKHFDKLCNTYDLLCLVTDK